jgi:xanthine/uracil permease
MFTTLAHAGYGMEMDGMTAIDHCMPIIIGAGIAIAILVGIVVYMLIAWEPKKPVKANKKKTSKN